MEILTDSETGTSDDKLRLFLIYYLLSPTVSDGEFDELSAALQGAGVGLSSLTYLRRCRQVSCCTVSYQGGLNATCSSSNLVNNEG